MFDIIYGWFKGFLNNYSYNSVYKKFIVKTDICSGQKIVCVLFENEMDHITDYDKDENIVIYDGARYKLWDSWTSANDEANRLNKLQLITKMESVLSTNFKESKFSSMNILLKLGQVLMAKFPEQFKDVSDTGVFLTEVAHWRYYEKFGKLVVTTTEDNVLRVTDANSELFDRAIEQLIKEFYSKSQTTNVEWVRELGILLNKNG